MATGNVKANRIFCSVENIGKVGFHIKNPLALVAYEVVMFMATMVVMCRTPATANFQQFARIRHLTQVPVNSGPSDGRMLLGDMVINLLGCCVNVEFFDGIDDQLPLNGIPSPAHVTENIVLAAPGTPCRDVLRPCTFHARCHGWRRGSVVSLSSRGLSCPGLHHARP